MMAGKVHKEEIFKRLKSMNVRQIKEFLYTSDVQFLGKEGFFNLFNEIKSMHIKSDDEGDRFEALDILIHELEFNYDAEFNLSEIANIRLYEDERRYFLEIVDTYIFPYKEWYFDDDKVRRKYWKKILYFYFFRGHLMSIELFYDSSASELFYNNLEKLKNFPFLKDLNFLFFDNYQLRKVKKILRNLNSLKNIKVYEFFRGDLQQPCVLNWKIDGIYEESF